MKRLIAGLAVLLALGCSNLAAASTLTLYDNYRGKNVAEDTAISQVVWTLVIQDGCTQCDVLLTAKFTGTSNYYVGQYIDSVQWLVSQPDVTPTSAGYQGFYVDGTQQNTAQNPLWSFALNQNVNANQCNNSSNAKDAVCGEWIDGGTAGGYGPIEGGMVLAWTFKTEFSTILSAAQSGNIRAGFNTSSGHNYNLFSPGGSAFISGGCTDITGVDCDSQFPPVPEPASVLMFGTGLMGITRWGFKGFRAVKSPSPRPSTIKSVPRLTSTVP